jgi:glycosyltransferase involved in cell wall biosynthesis
MDGAASSRPLNFLHLTTFYPPYSFGGDALYVYRLAQALAQAGHHVDVAHCVDSYHLLHPAEPSPPPPSHPLVSTHQLHTGWRWLSPLLSHQTGQPWMKRRQLRRLLASRPYDVIHYHNISLLGPGVLSLQAEGSRALKLYTAHEHWLICPLHVLWKFNRRPCEKPQCLPCSLLARRPPQFWRYTGLLERASRQVDLFYSFSRFTISVHSERGFCRPLEYLPSFAERADADWQQPGPRPHPRPYFLFVGRLELIKGLHTLIPLWDRIPDADLLVAGAGDQEPQLRAQAAHNPRIRFLGWLPEGALGPLYVHALAVIIPSLTYEVLGLVTLEAFARKTPAIVRDLGGLIEAVQDSGGGFIYQTDQQLLEAISRLAASPALRAELGNRGYQAFVSRWCLEVHLESYMRLLNELALRKFGAIPWESHA